MNPKSHTHRTDLLKTETRKPPHSKMATQFEKLKHRSWTRDGYLISTDHTLIPAQGVNAMFASPNVYWANPMPEEVMEEMLRSSLCFGLFKTHGEERQFIGLARCVTDFTTFVYLTDVYIMPEHQGGGLGKWLIGCVDEVVGGMEWLRRAMLFTSDWEVCVANGEIEECAVL